jgi:hypothetical protein
LIEKTIQSTLFWMLSRTITSRLLTKCFVIKPWLKIKEFT